METTISVLGGMFDSTKVVEVVDGFPRGDKAVDSAFFAQMLRCFFSDGIIRPDSGTLAVEAGEGMLLQVSPGCGWIQGRMAWIKEPAVLPVEAGHSYLVTLCLHREDGQFSLDCREDVADLRRTDRLWDLLLARVQVPADAESITADMITDCRVDPEVCGPVISPLDALQTVAYALDSGTVGGVGPDGLMLKSGGRMTGNLIASPDTSGIPVVRNIRYGTALPETVAEGEIFILLEEA